MTKVLLHIEGFAILSLSVYLYGYFQFSWLLFFILLFAPDIAMVGYVISNKVGSVAYNLFHTYSVPIILILVSVMFSNLTLLSIGFIWSAHIGMDRMLGYGLKYSTAFKDTHLNRV
ncbi:DUF4260 family protein [Anaerobacillus alkaliphilus]|uniref:DUF4260 family protein n=1 Tax=Anaerobacillus alkaliphilus TaxID=1548597 RepID=A0A4Q0VMR7_9BACI|nr:DUF4260 domain-containing protein [Anaerobacillus alkaliphilus]RXI96423.1 DUF4260 family protein [Anaerobacillus alkaliphilus]